MAVPEEYGPDAERQEVKRDEQEETSTSLTTQVERSNSHSYRRGEIIP